MQLHGADGPVIEIIKRASSKYDAVDEEEDDELDEVGGDDDDLDLGLHLPKVDLDIDLNDESETVAAD